MTNFLRGTLVALTLVLSGPALAQPAVAADCASDPVTAKRGAEPLCDTPNGRTFSLDVSSAEPGQSIGFRGTGFVRDAGGGQTLTLKFNDIDVIGSRIVADDDGSVSGRVTLPTQQVFDAYATQYGAERWWVRVLVGTGRADGASDMPAASLHDEFTLAKAADPGDDDGNGTGDGNGNGNPGSNGTGTTGGTSTGNGTDGTIPKAGLTDDGGLTLGVLLVTGAAALLWFERRLRRARASG